MAKRSSPCTWGCFFLRSSKSGREHVFPMHVGVFLILMKRVGSALCLPHARGGVSFFDQARVAVNTSSPCTWGCF